jgi:thiamine-phosphate pyrophosphorylase
MRSGADVIQYREKHFERSQHLEELKAILQLRAQYPETRVIINDYLDLAVELQADGVHLGQEDPRLSEALTRLPADNIIGATVHNEAELRYAEQYPVTYIGVGPVFGSASKSVDLPPLTLEGLQKLAMLTNLPIIGIGNIQGNNLRSVLEHGASGVAVVSSFCDAEHPESALSVMCTTVRDYWGLPSDAETQL